ncbi:hypothetical protein C7380_1108 [Oceanotoga teriensis]|jgi:hypothetical protein|uniref:Amidase n=1 Tax=Oceanotoga teriensis TaxID=515440 RepID=A0AA45C6D0_9BACT|nr:amidase [Oceanotoga teriensis]PWJ92015.1 hypothetical protein C7380_1108 [Oceanotoga teriensis]
MRDKLVYKIAKKNIKAFDFKDITIEKINTDILNIMMEKIETYDDFYTFGVKNTSSINKDIIRKLSNKNYLFHTIDKMSDGGRAIDINIKNPITGKNMTGSSSASAVNVLYGINDFAIATDGGGSVINPAISLNLFSILLKGAGLKAKNSKKSTDNIEFTAGTGIISKNFEIIENIFKLLFDIKPENKKYIIAIPSNLYTADDKPMKETLENIIKNVGNVQIKEFKYPDFSNREESIKQIKKIFKEVDFISCMEGPTDIYGMGDSVFGCMGETYKNEQNKSGKYLSKIANMINSSAISIPTNELSKSLLICSKENVQNTANLIEFCKQIYQIYELPELYKRYFLKSYERKKQEYFFKEGD